MSMIEIGKRPALSISEVIWIFKPRIAVSIMLRPRVASPVAARDRPTP